MAGMAQAAQRGAGGPGGARRSAARAAQAAQAAQAERSAGGPGRSGSRRPGPAQAERIAGALAELAQAERIAGALAELSRPGGGACPGRRVLLALALADRWPESWPQAERIAGALAELAQAGGPGRPEAARVAIKAGGGFYSQIIPGPIRRRRSGSPERWRPAWR